MAIDSGQGRRWSKKWMQDTWDEKPGRDGWIMARSKMLLAQPGKIGTMNIRNRVVMPAMGTNMANLDGTPSQNLIDYYEARAAGGAGMIITEVVTPDGLYLGNTMLVNTDWKRVRHFVTKLVRGLYFFEFGTSLPTATFISIPECHAEHLDLSEPHSLTRRGKRTWPGTFEYKCNRVEDHPEQSAWMFRFLNTNVFLAFTGTQQEEKPGRTSKTNVQ